MKILLFILVILLSYNCVQAQEKESELDISADILAGDNKNALTEGDEEKFTGNEVESAPNAFTLALNEEKAKARLEFIEAEKERFGKRKDFFDETSGKIETDIKVEERFHWKAALVQSGIFLGIQHGVRLTQSKTRSELGGKFLNDWGKSVKGLRGWNDSDNFFTNYIAHSLQGGLTGRIFVNNSDRAKKQEFGKSKEYWESRSKALAWSVFWSTQFELGPISEASIGNVGIREKRGYSTMAWGDLVITPTVGTGILIAEDFIDKYVLRKWIERNNDSRITTRIRILRMLLTPTTSFANLLRGKSLWKRDFRPN